MSLGSSDPWGDVGSRRAALPCSQSTSKATWVTIILACGKEKSSLFPPTRWGGSCTYSCHNPLVWLCHMTALSYKCEKYSLVSKKKTKNINSLHDIFIHLYVSEWFYSYHHTKKTLRLWIEPDRKRMWTQKLKTFKNW